MKITILPRADDITHVALSGRLDTSAVTELDESFSQATAARERPTIVDLSEIDFMASSGIGMLLSSSKRLRKGGHRFVLLNPQKLVDASLRTARMETVMPIAYDLDEAIRIVHGGEGSHGPASLPVETAADSSCLSRSESDAAVSSVLSGELKLSMKNELSELKNVSATLAQFLEDHCVPKRAAYAVSLAVDELVVNAMSYAYVDDEVHVIELDLNIQGDQVILRIVDDGRPFDPRTGPSLDLHSEERQVGGLGLLLVLDMVDVLKYQRLDEKNWVEVRIRLFKEDERGDLPGAPSHSGEP
jgi:serine/threonine-protein kinase RsbW/sigma-B regulation protein RsbU (phosphoserine phosphatase)